MTEIVNTFPPKEVIAYFNNQYITPYLTSRGFKFNETSLEFHRKNGELKQIIAHRCSRNNMTGRIIDFEIYHQNLCPKFRTWYKNRYSRDPVGGPVIIGHRKLLCEDKWNPKYSKLAYRKSGSTWYDLINHDISDQFAVILENLTNVQVPFLDYFKDFDTIIDNPNERVDCEGYPFDIFSHVRQIEHCLFLKKTDKAKTLAESLLNNPLVTTDNKQYITQELTRVFI